ncbi:MAG: 30S ribosomal protein S4 [Dehalococcoidia bacterium]|nr:30S ribosomal protein S4 [Dehalococcoidia bacterium]MDZ4246966.1 30S ribosomal protein S4 [Dehalococcoidia bacterium]
MARYIDAVCRLCRRSGQKLMLKGERCFTPKCGVERRSAPPGQQVQRRRKVSDRGIQLREKQKARYIYGLLERQFRKTFREAERRPGKTGENLLQLLETRFDSIVLQLGFADSRAQARQIVRHGHLTVNGKRANIPSMRLNAGDTIGWREGSKKSEYFKELVETIKSKSSPDWLSVDKENISGRVISLPTGEDFQPTFDESVIIAYYSR